MIFGFALQPATELPVPPAGYLNQVLAFIYTLAHGAGELVVGLIERIVPLEKTGASLVDPIGLLVLVTALLLLAEMAKKLAWLVVVVGWALIVIRIVLEVSSR